jgi:hypothetical protein
MECKFAAWYSNINNQCWVLKTATNALTSYEPSWWSLSYCTAATIIIGWTKKGKVRRGSCQSAETKPNVIEIVDHVDASKSAWQTSGWQ